MERQTVSGDTISSLDRNRVGDEEEATRAPTHQRVEEELEADSLLFKADTKEESEAFGHVYAVVGADASSSRHRYHHRHYRGEGRTGGGDVRRTNGPVSCGVVLFTNLHDDFDESDMTQSICAEQERAVSGSVS